MTSKRILFQFFRDQAESEKGHEGGGMAGVDAFNPVQSSSS